MQCEYKRSNQNRAHLNFHKLITFFFNAKDSFNKNVSRTENMAHSVAKYRNMRFEAEIVRKTMVWGRHFFYASLTGMLVYWYTGGRHPESVNRLFRRYKTNHFWQDKIRFKTVFIHLASETSGLATGQHGSFAGQMIQNDQKNKKQKA